MQTFIEKQKNNLLRKFHTLCGKAGVNEYEKDVILASYGVSTSKDLNVYELTELCGNLDLRANPEKANIDKWRKRVIAAIGSYLETMHKPSDIDKIKAIACRASECNSFNKIPMDRLRSLYNAFSNRKKDLINVDVIIALDIYNNKPRQTNLN